MKISLHSNLKRRQRGFTMIEMLVVVLILMVVTGVIFSEIDLVQKRYRSEVDKTDATQEARETLQQIMRDLRQSGFPNELIFSDTPDITSDKRAVGLVAISADDLWFEGDVDADGTVDSVRYTLYTDEAEGEDCPCNITRAQVSKINGVNPWEQDTSANAYNAMFNVINSGALYGLAGTSNLPNGTTEDNADLYEDWMAAPVFQAYDALGTEITLPKTLETDGAAVMKTIRTIRVTINTMGFQQDMQTGRKPVISLSNTTRLINLE